MSRSGVGYVLLCLAVVDWVGESFRTILASASVGPRQEFPAYPTQPRDRDSNPCGPSDNGS